MKKWYMIPVVLLLSVFLTACIKIEFEKPGATEETMQETIESPVEDAAVQETEVSAEAPLDQTDQAEDSPYAAQGTCGLNAVWTVDKNGHLTISGVGDMYDGWRIADEMTQNGGDVWDSDSWEHQIYSIEIQQGITLIGEDAFCFCDKATEVSLPDGLEEIGARAFSGGVFQEIVLPDSLLEIGEEAFYDTALTHVTLPHSVEKIGLYAFRGGAIQNIYVAEDNEDFASVYGCLYSKDQTVLLQCPRYRRGVVQVAEGTKTIAKGAFADCWFVTQIDIPSSITNIEAGAFYSCNELKSIEVSDGSNYKIIDGMLYHSPTMTLVYCPSGAAKDVVVPNGTKIIDSYALQDSELWSVTIPSSVEVIEEEAFGWNLTAPIHYEGTWDAWQKIVIRDSNVLSVSVYTK
ncbi:MAG: leucine-rich repeat domain-containing protein [Oscillospiraceae bacterium]|nr:leucine-rich repeat domain-containing protein [Oscillospiraceae bacterium]